MGRRKEKLRPMNVKDLRNALKGVPGNIPVVMADDASVTVAKFVTGAESNRVGGSFVISDPDPEEWEDA